MGFRTSAPASAHVLSAQISTDPPLPRICLCPASPRTAMNAGRVTFTARGGGARGTGNSVPPACALQADFQEGGTREAWRQRSPRPSGGRSPRGLLQKAHPQASLDGRTDGRTDAAHPQSRCFALSRESRGETQPPPRSWCPTPPPRRPEVLMSSTRGPRLAPARCCPRVKPRTRACKACPCQHRAASSMPPPCHGWRLQAQGGAGVEAEEGTVPKPWGPWPLPVGPPLNGQIVMRGRPLVHSHEAPGPTCQWGLHPVSHVGRGAVAAAGSSGKVGAGVSGPLCPHPGGWAAGRPGVGPGTHRA